MENQTSYSEITLICLRSDTVKSWNIFISLRKCFESGASSGNILSHLPVGGCLGGCPGWIGIRLLALLDVPRACSKQNKGYAQMSIIPLRYRGRPHLVGRITSCPARKNIKMFPERKACKDAVGWTES